MRARYYYDLHVSRRGEIRDRDNEKPDLSRGPILGRIKSIGRQGYLIEGTQIGSLVGPIVKHKKRSAALAHFINEIQSAQCGAEHPTGSPICTEPKGHGRLFEKYDHGEYGVYWTTLEHHDTVVRPERCGAENPIDLTSLCTKPLGHKEPNHSNGDLFWLSLSATQVLTKERGGENQILTVPERCGAENPDYPGEYSCIYPKGHAPLSDEIDHGSPKAGAYWKASEEMSPEENRTEDLMSSEGWLIKSLQVYREERTRLEWRAKKISAAVEALQEAQLSELAHLVALSGHEIELAIDVTKQREEQIQNLIDLTKAQ